VAVNAYKFLKGSNVHCTSSFTGKNYSSFKADAYYVFMGLDSEDDVQLGEYDGFGNVRRVGDCTPIEFSSHFE
jgi:hypothetical protein